MTKGHHTSPCTRLRGTRGVPGQRAMHKAGTWAGSPLKTRARKRRALASASCERAFECKRSLGYLWRESVRRDRTQGFFFSSCGPRFPLHYKGQRAYKQQVAVNAGLAPRVWRGETRRVACPSQKSEGQQMPLSDSDWSLQFTRNVLAVFFLFSSLRSTLPSFLLFLQ